MRGVCVLVALLCGGLLGDSLAEVGLRPALGADAQRRTNVLLICADDHAAYVTGAYGNARVRTPAIDALAAAGMRFDAAYCNSPVCTASRQSLLTGRYPRSLGVTRLETALPESETTLADVFAAAGYRTASIGKMHFNSPLKHGFELRVDHAEYQAWLREQPSDSADPGSAESPPPGVAVQPPWRPFRDPARTWLNSDCRPIGQRERRTDASYFVQRAAEYLAQQDERPFFLMVSFYEPHSPFRFPLEYAGRHTAGEFAVPAVGGDDARQVPAVFRDLTAAEKQGIAAAYYTSVEYLDANVGRVLAALEQSGHDRDTLVVYLGDHGYMLGQHDRFEKHCSYEEAVRVPLAMRLPGRIAPGSATPALVELVDLAPTLCELTGVPTAQAMQGRSLAGLVEGDAKSLGEGDSPILLRGLRNIGTVPGRCGDSPILLPRHRNIGTVAGRCGEGDLLRGLRNIGTVPGGSRTSTKSSETKPSEAIPNRGPRAVLSAGHQKHRDHVIVEYAPNDEVMIRDERWKLVYERGAQRRTDGYDTGLPLERHWLRLFDTQNDPQELASVAGDPQNAAIIARLQKLLIEHLIRTARQPELIPTSDDPLVVFDHCVQSRDVQSPVGR